MESCTAPICVSARSLVLVTLICLWAASCGSRIPAPQPPNKKDTVPVSGEVWLDGEPGWGVVVTLSPQGGTDSSNPTVSLGEGDKQGRFVVRTYGTEDGAPPGEYVLTFVQYDRSVIRIGGGDPPDLLKGRFANPTSSRHTASVPADAESVDLGRIDLRTSR